MADFQANWNRPFPRIVHPVTSTPLPEDTDIICLVPGTDILLLSTAGSVICWNAKLATKFPLPAVEFNHFILEVSPPWETSGIYSIAFLTGDNVAPVAHIHIITITHEAGEALILTSVFSEIPVPHVHHLKSVFLGEEMVGTISVGSNQEDCIVSLCPWTATGSNFHPDSTRAFKIPGNFSNHPAAACFVFEDHLYHLIENGQSVQIHHISRTSLLSGKEGEQSTLCTSDIPGDFRSSWGMVPTTLLYGVSAVFVRSTDTKTRITFVPNALTHEVSSPLAFDVPCVSLIVEGNCDLMWLDHSGFNAALVVHKPPAAYNLLLVRYHSDTQSTSLHELKVPEAIDLSNMKELCVDDSAGTIRLVNKEGLFST
ncbi:hypothetical protein C8F04DRAFT_1396017 [Mycena alexandri]|uniref:Uncharacterized protein n=1 Tax=Mycena alexandri TaxID=1745969 RepID=A0AAD6STG0_9AGAR|nr:hypothetical protein C8F04DRAFT_1396017 [Mycena alexandri]